MRYRRHPLRQYAALRINRYEEPAPCRKRRPPRPNADPRVSCAAEGDVAGRMTKGRGVGAPGLCVSPCIQETEVGDGRVRRRGIFLLRRRRGDMAPLARLRLGSRRRLAVLATALRLGAASGPFWPARGRQPLRRRRKRALRRAFRRCLGTKAAASRRRSGASAPSRRNWRQAVAWRPVWAGRPGAAGESGSANHIHTTIPHVRSDDPAPRRRVVRVLG